MKKFLFALVICTIPISTFAAEIITKASPHAVVKTMDQLVAAVVKAGATVFVRVDHAAGATAIGSELKPNQMLVFGNPKIGTPIMQANPMAGLDLPIRVVVFENADGMTSLAYRDPNQLTADHSVPGDLKALKMMAGALEKLTGAAIK